MIEASHPSPLRVIAVGPLPPPPGGVASSLQNLREAAAHSEYINVDVIPWTKLWTVPFRRPDVLHLHFSKAAKRAFGTMIAYLSGSRVVHTIHGNQFDFSLLGNRIACRLSHGFILLNSDIEARFRAIGKIKTSLMTPILETKTDTAFAALDARLESFLTASKEPVALVYANNRRMINGRDIYGFPFIASILPRMAAAGWRVIFLDPNGHYSASELNLAGSQAAYLHDDHVDFKALLKRVAIYLRPTSSDGNSVAVLEALASRTPVLASDAVPRPPGVTQYKAGDVEDFFHQLQELMRADVDKSTVRLTSLGEYINFLRTLK